MTTKQLLGTKSTTFRQRVVSLVAGGFFLPVVIVGPVMSGTALWDQTDPTRDETDAWSTEFLYRKLFSGWLLATLASEWCAQLADGPGLARPTAPLVVVLLGIGARSLLSGKAG